MRFLSHRPRYRGAYRRHRRASHGRSSTQKGFVGVRLDSARPSRTPTRALLARTAHDRRDVRQRAAPAAANLGAAVTSRRQGSALLKRATAPKQGAITVRVRSSRRSRASCARPSRWDASPRDPPRPSRAKPSRSPSRSPVDDSPSPPPRPAPFSAAARASSLRVNAVSSIPAPPTPPRASTGIRWVLA